MGSSSGNSSGSTQLQNSGSEEDLQVMMDQRKRKRMESNRESARRSRMRKQQHLDELSADVLRLTKAKNQILTDINITTQHLMNLESENSVLRAQVAELNQRLQSLRDILIYIHNTNSNGVLECDDENLQTTADASDHTLINPWNLLCFNQPIMANADMLQY